MLRHHGYNLLVSVYTDPLDDRSAEFYALLNFPDEGTRAGALAQYREITTPLRAFVPAITWEEVARAFRAGFADALRVALQPGEVTATEWDLARDLARDKYSQLAWQSERVRML